MEFVAEPNRPPTDGGCDTMLVFEVFAGVPLPPTISEDAVMGKIEAEDDDPRFCWLNEADMLGEADEVEDGPG